MNIGLNKCCTMCKQTMNTSLFNKHCGTKDGYQTACRQCLKFRSKLWESNPINRRNRKLKQKYGINCEIYDIMLLEQKGKCKICGTTETRNKMYQYFPVDHCHKTGKVRGLLCDYCNVGLGRFEDDIERLENAIKYLKESK